LAEPEFQAWLPRLVIVLPETVPLSALLAVAVEVLKALLNVPVEPLFNAADRSPPALAAPEFLFWLVSLLSLVVVVVVVVVVVAAELVVLLAVLLLLLELSVVVVLRLELSVSAVLMLLVLPPSVFCVLATCAMAAELSP
jgi:hypothetical protein